MYVAVSILPKSVAVTQLALQDGQLVATANMLELAPGTKIGHVPAERLRLMGEGIQKSNAFLAPR